MKKALFATLAVAALMAGTAEAASVSYSDTFSFPLSPGTATVSLPKFDDLGGTLTLSAVELTLDGTIQASVTGENDSSISGSMSLSLTGNMSAVDEFNILSVALVLNNVAGPVSVQPTDGVAGSGPDFHNFGTVSQSDSDDDLTISSLASFLGTGTFDVDINGSGGFAISGVTDSTQTISGFGATGEATVTYSYVPEPTTMALLSLGGLAIIRRKRS